MIQRLTKENTFLQNNPGIECAKICQILNTARSLTRYYIVLESVLEFWVFETYWFKKKGFLAKNGFLTS